MGKTKTKKVHSDIVRDSINTFGTNAIGALLSLIGSLLVLSRVAPDVKGLYNQVQTWGSGFNSILGLSISAAIVYFVARYSIGNTKKAIRKLTVSIALLILVVASVVLITLRHSSFFATTSMQFLVGIVVYGILSLLLGVSNMMLRGENKFKSYNLVNLTQQVLILAVYVVVFFHPSAALWVWATNGVTFLMICFSFYGVLRWNGSKPVPASENDRPVKAGEMVNYSLRSHVSNVMTYVTTYLGSYVVQGRYNLKTFGVYSFATTMSQQLSILPDAVSQVIMSRIASMGERNDKVRLTVLSAKIVTYITVVTAALLLLVAKYLVPVLFPLYAGAVEPLGYLIIGSIFISFAKVLNNSIAAYGRPELNIIPTAAGIVANIGSTLLFVPLGVNGIAIATSISLTVQGLVSLGIFCRFSHTKPYRIFIPSKDEIASLRGVLHR
jgi:O-antigen/teichoic acid export membrane protein